MYQVVLEFWFKELSFEDWWRKNINIDDLIKSRFGDLHRKACMGELWQWRENPKSALAEIIVLDQFSRHIYRNDGKSFAFDGIALSSAQSAVSKKFDLQISGFERGFLYMPFMHSESLIIHNEAINLFNKEDIVQYYESELKHKAIIEKFGRYPHILITTHFTK